VKIILTFLFLMLTIGQSRQTNERWSAQWIAVPEAQPFAFGVYHFRRTFELAAKPSSFVVHVSADNRYRLFVNGESVALGPARGDLNHWRYETVELAPHLRAGKNVVAAVVWNFAQYAPEAQVTNQTAFLLHGESERERAIDTNNKWKCTIDRAYEPAHYTSAQMHGYFVAGPGERFEAAKYPWGWETIDFDDSTWLPAQALSGAAPRDARDGPNRWLLVPRIIPPEEQRPDRLQVVRQSTGVIPPAEFPRRPSPLRIPAKTKAHLLLDQSYLTTAYPEVVFTGGRNSQISIGYAESLFTRSGNRLTKGNRNEVDGKEFLGYFDTVVSDGGSRRLYRPLWWRTWRYLDLRIETQDEPLTIEDIRGVFTGYPFERKAKFESDSGEIGKILDVGWRTARLCAHETYMDCPYYEQLQYAGDTRIQGLVSLYNSGDPRLVRNAISLLNDSRTAEGATMSRAPTRQQQYIPPFSLWWLGMLHDYWMYVDDPGFVREMLPGVRSVLTFFAGHQMQEGSLGRVPWWNFVDWAREWPNGVPPADADGSSAPLDLQLLLGYQWAADLEDALGSKPRAGEYRQAAAQLTSSIRRLYWDSGRHLFSDTARKATFSQQTNALAVLAGVTTGAEAREVVGRTLADDSLVKCTIYFRHYLHSAVNLTGLGDRYLDLLGQWREMLGLGLTTWAEWLDRPDGSARSDCHAWSASPNFELFRTVLGIDSAAPGFSRVIIRPYPGKLTRVSGSIPHPKGQVSVDLKINGEKLTAEIELPPGVRGELVWKEQKRSLQPGKTTLSL
jgi:alpha-L-rhamnosidase